MKTQPDRDQAIIADASIDALLVQLRDWEHVADFPMEIGSQAARTIDALRQNYALNLAQALREMLHEGNSRIEAAQAETAAARAEVAADRQNAKRYRWLRQRGAAQDFVMACANYEEDLDEAVDTAMSQEKT